MIDVLSEDHLIGSGVNASLFALGPDRVLKLYRAEGPAVWQAGQPRLHAQELRAYELASANPVLSGHVARSYGREEVRRVVDASGTDVSERYHLPLGIVLERLSGVDVKLSELPELPAHLVSLLGGFDAGGIYALDASVFEHGSEENCRLIDLTTHLGNRLNCELIAADAASNEELEDWLKGS